MKGRRLNKFITIDDMMINIDHIIRISQEGKNRLTFHMDDGSVIESEGTLWNILCLTSGHSEVVSLSPCKDVCALMCKDGKQTLEPVLQLAACADGTVRPIDISSGFVRFLDEAASFCGLTTTTSDMKYRLDL